MSELARDLSHAVLVGGGMIPCACTCTVNAAVPQQNLHSNAAMYMYCPAKYIV